MKVLIVLVVLAVSGCTDGHGDARSTTSTVDAPTTLAELAVVVGCEHPMSIDELEGPIRGGAARDGVKCYEDPIALDLFERDGVAGTLENIDRLLNAYPSSATPNCGVLVTDEWIVTSNRREELERVEDLIGGAVRPITPLSAPVSYMVTGCN